MCMKQSSTSYAPGFSSGIIGMQVLTPPDIEAKIGSPHGHIFHGELQVDQLFWARPAPHWADYRTPIAGLYQCGSSAHPGGGVGGVPGYNAAREILKDRRADEARLKGFGRIESWASGAARPRAFRGAAKRRAAQHRETVLPWSIDSETGVLTDVLLCRPDHYQWIETNAIAVQTLASGRPIDAQRLQAEFRELEDALDQAGVRRHYLEPEPHLPYQVYTRNSSQTTPWGPALTQLALAPRRGEIASVLRFHAGRDGFWRYCSHGAIEGGDIHIIRPGLLLVGWSGSAHKGGRGPVRPLVRRRGLGDEALLIPRTFPSPRRPLLHGCARARGGLRRGFGRRFRPLAESARYPRDRSDLSRGHGDVVQSPGAWRRPVSRRATARGSTRRCAPRGSRS